MCSFSRLRPVSYFSERFLDSRTGAQDDKDAQGKEVRSGGSGKVDSEERPSRQVAEHMGYEDLLGFLDRTRGFRNPLEYVRRFALPICTAFLVPFC